MARIAKDPEVRRNELMEAAEELFLAKGFDRTLVSDIVKKLGVAQGTFYYYFKSKDEVMIAILDKMWRDYAAGSLSLLERADMNPYEKLLGIFRQLFKRESPRDERLKIFDVVEDEIASENFHNYSDGARIKYFGPVIKQLVREGIAAGVFMSMDYADEITEIIFMGVNTYMHTYSPMFGDLEVYVQKTAALQELFEKILGLERGSFKLIDVEGCTL